MITNPKIILMFFTALTLASCAASRPNSLTKEDGVSSGGLDVETDDKIVVDCLVSQRRFTAWEWNGEKFWQLKRVQLVNSYLSGKLLYAKVKLLTDEGLVSSHSKITSPVTVANFPFNTSLSRPIDGALHLKVVDGKISGEIAGRDLAPVVSIPLTNCVEGENTATVATPNEEVLPAAQEASFRFRQSALNSDAFTEIRLTRDANGAYSAEKLTLSTKETIGSSYSCAVDHYLDFMWALVCSGPDRRPVDGEKRDLVIVSYDGSTYFAVEKIFGPSSHKNDYKIKHLAKGLRQEPSDSPVK